MIQFYEYIKDEYAVLLQYRVFIKIRTNNKYRYFYKIRGEKCSSISHLPFYVYIDVVSIIFYKYYKYK